MGYIYKITNLINEKVYIGQTRRHYTERWAQHNYDKNREPYCNWPLYRMLNSVPSEKVKWEVVEEVDNNLLDERERYWIAFYNSKKQGYNCTDGGSNGAKYDYNEILEFWLGEGERNFTKTAIHFQTDKTYISKIIASLGYQRRTWEEINNSNHDSIKRKVNKIDLSSGRVIKTYNSIVEAAKDLGNIDYRKTIPNVCSGKIPSYLGFGWQYTEDIGKPIYLNKQQKYIIIPEYDLTFNNCKECAKWFIANGFSRSKNETQVAKSINYALKHSKVYQHIKIDEKEKVVYSYYE